MHIFSNNIEKKILASTNQLTKVRFHIAPITSTRVASIASIQRLKLCIVACGLRRSLGGVSFILSILL
jgi:hypothetical protein